MKQKPAKKTTQKPKEKSHESVKKPARGVKIPRLNHRQQIFVQEYLVDFNLKRAAIAAGYSERSAYAIGSENLRKPLIKAEIEAETNARKDKITVSAEEVIRELALIGMANMSDFVKVNEDGSVQAIPLDKLSEGKSRIIKKVKEKRVIKSTAEGDTVLDGTYEFELCDKVKSLELLARHHGILHDKQEIDVKQPVQVVIKKFVRKNNGTAKTAS